jgi:hypothetical protein
MLKRAFVRLLLFGVPFTFGYLASRPAPASKVGPAFVICADRNGEMRVTPSSATCAAGSTILVPAGRDLANPPSIEDGTDKSIKLPF